MADKTCGRCGYPFNGPGDLCSRCGNGHGSDIIPRPPLVIIEEMDEEDDEEQKED